MRREETSDRPDQVRLGENPYPFFLRSIGSKASNAAGAPFILPTLFLARKDNVPSQSSLGSRSPNVASAKIFLAMTGLIFLSTSVSRRVAQTNSNATPMTRSVSGLKFKPSRYCVI